MCQSVDLYAELVAIVSALEASGIDYALCAAVAPRAIQDSDILVLCPR